jgi:uncharacterized protein YdeI (YjbR/CyaY-like superfamily)
MEPVFFKDVKELRKWFKKNHGAMKELWVGFYKKSTGRGGVTYPEAVDTALCFGWIDGIRKSYDEVSYVNRFTPRNPKSNWSLVNIKKVEELKKAGLMEPAGLAAYALKREDKSGVYSYEQAKIVFDEKYAKGFKKNKKAWKFFEETVPSYKKPAVFWVISAKKEETRMKRLNILISCSEKGEKIPMLRREE